MQYLHEKRENELKLRNEEPNKIKLKLEVRKAQANLSQRQSNLMLQNFIWYLQQQ